MCLFLWDLSFICWRLDFCKMAVKVMFRKHNAFSHSPPQNPRLKISDTFIPSSDT